MTPTNLPVAQGLARLPANRRRGSSRSRGFTLIEMLVSLAITMIMMGAVVTLFGTITDSVSGSRALIELSDRLRSCRNRLQADLQGVTVTTLPPRRPENDEGYLEIIEGPDNDFAHATLSPPTIFGDADDVIMFTTRSRGEPFVGRFNLGAVNGTIESQVAEVMYFAVPNGQSINLTGNATNSQLYTLYRRVLLVVPGAANNPSFVASASTLPSPQFYGNLDLSARFDLKNSKIIPNTLGDLTKPENRFAHNGQSGFPFSLNAQHNPSIPKDDSYLAPFNSVSVVNRTGDDVIMTNVLAFDVQVYDPLAPVQLNGGLALTPNDAGYNSGGGAPYSGAYVDLGYPVPSGVKNKFGKTASPNSPPSVVTGSTPVTLRPYLPGIASSMTIVQGTAPIPASAIGNAYIYDTWSLHYENDGVLENTSFSGPDLATNGLDDAVPPTNTANGIVDDSTEYETQPPFAAQLRGIKVTIRVYEPTSQQVREVTVVQDFLPE